MYCNPYLTLTFELHLRDYQYNQSVPFRGGLLRFAPGNDILQRFVKNFHTLPP